MATAEQKATMHAELEKKEAQVGVVCFFLSLIYPPLLTAFDLVLGCIYS